MIQAAGVVLLFAVCAVVLGIGVLFLSYLLRMRGSPEVGKTVYECGESPFGDARILFNPHFYILVLVYVIFAVEIVFLYPWAASLRLLDNKLLLLGEMVLFIAILAFGLAYAWKREALEWF